MSAKIVQLQTEQSGGVIEGLRPHVIPGVYQLAYLGYSTMLFCKKPKVILRFRVVTMGEYFGVELERFYNVRRLIGKPGKNGRFKVGASSDLVLEFCRVSVGRINRLDRLPLSTLKNSIILGEVHTVETNRNQKDLPELLKYSVIKELTGIES
jgi:hypothetical protein